MNTPTIIVTTPLERLKKIGIIIPPEMFHSINEDPLLQGAFMDDLSILERAPSSYEKLAFAKMYFHTNFGIVPDPLPENPFITTSFSALLQSSVLGPARSLIKKFGEYSITTSGFLNQVQWHPLARLIYFQKFSGEQRAINVATNPPHEQHVTKYFMFARPLEIPSFSSLEEEYTAFSTSIDHALNIARTTINNRIILHSTQEHAEMQQLFDSAQFAKTLENKMEYIKRGLLKKDEIFKKEINQYKNQHINTSEARSIVQASESIENQILYIEKSLKEYVILQKKRKALGISETSIEFSEQAQSQVEKLQSWGYAALGQVHIMAILSAWNIPTNAPYISLLDSATLNKLHTISQTLSKKSGKSPKETLSELAKAIDGYAPLQHLWNDPKSLANWLKKYLPTETPTFITDESIEAKPIVETANVAAEPEKKQEIQETPKAEIKQKTPTNSSLFDIIKNAESTDILQPQKQETTKNNINIHIPVSLPHGKFSFLTKHPAYMPPPPSSTQSSASSGT